MAKLLFSLGLFFTLSLPALAQVPNGALYFGFNVRTVNGTTTQKAKISSAIAKIKKVIASEEFRTRVINHTYNGSKTFVDNGGLTNLQIYNKIVGGAEILYPIINNMMDMEIEFYTNAFTSTVGYTYPNSTRIWMNTKFFNNYTSSEVTGNMFHEWLHKLGFKHTSYYTTARRYSVPYAVGYLMAELAAKY
jgi:hypothetical protein